MLGLRRLQAVNATAWAFRTLWIASQVLRRDRPIRRRAAGVVAGKQDQRGLGGGVVEGAFQGGYSRSWARNLLVARVRSAVRL